MTQKCLSAIFDVQESTVCRVIRRIAPIISDVLAIQRSRKIDPKEMETIILDATEQEIQRPKKKQKRYYSGKKKRHTIKTEWVINEAGRIVEISKPAPGSMHDLQIRKRGKKLPHKSRILADSGYQGYQNDHNNLTIPIKKSKKNPLSKEDKKFNHQLSKKRIRIENKIRELKIFKILSGVYRNRLKCYGLVTNIIAGLVNLKNGFFST